MQTKQPTESVRGVLLVGPPGSKRSEKLLETARAFAPAEVVTCYSLRQLSRHFGLRCLVGKRVLLVDTLLLSDLFRNQELFKALMSGPCNVELMHTNKPEIVGPIYVAIAVPGTLADLAPLDPALRHRLRIIETPTQEDLRNIFGA